MRLHFHYFVCEWKLTYPQRTPLILIIGSEEEEFFGIGETHPRD